MLKLISQNSVTNYNIELKECNTYGELIKKIISTLNTYIYSIQFIEFFMKNLNENTEEYTIEIITVGEDISLFDKFKYENIVEIKVYEREKDSEGKIKDSILIDKYINYQREIADHDMAIQMQDEYDYTSSTPRTIRRRLRMPPTRGESIEGELNNNSSDNDEAPDFENNTDLPFQIPINNPSANLRAFLNSVLSNDAFNNAQNIHDIGDNDESADNEQLTNGQENITNLINSDSFRSEIRNSILNGLLYAPNSTNQLLPPIGPTTNTNITEPLNSNFIASLFSGNPSTWHQQLQNHIQEQQNANQEDIKVVLKESDFNQLQIKKYGEIKDDSNYPKITKCSLTLEEFKNDDNIVILPCKHYFSMNIKDWLTKYSHKCMICRAEAGKGTPLL